MPSTPEALHWQAALERKLKKASSNQLEVPYEQVARAFPSQNPDPETFDFSLIDDMTFIPWAEVRGWRAIVIPDSSAGETSFPFILFTKIT